MTFVTKQAGLLRSARRWGALGLLLVLGVGSGTSPGEPALSYQGQAQCIQPPSGLVAWWPLDDAVGQSTAQDLIGGYNGTTKDITNNTVINIGPPGGVRQLPDPAALSGTLNPVVVDPTTSPPRGALFFRSSFVDVPHNPNLNISASGFTITLWAWAAPTPVAITPLIEKFDPTSGNGYRLYLEVSGGTYVVKLNLNGTIITGPAVPFGTTPQDWRFIVARIAPSGNVTLAVGDLSGSFTTTTATVTSVVTTNGAPLWFVKGTGFPTIGLVALDEIEIFNRPLTASELQTIYDGERQGRRKCSLNCVPPPSGMVAWYPLDETSGTTANDIAGFPNNGTHVNGPTPTPGIVAGALRFDGVDDHVRVPDHAELNVGTGNFTLDAWVRTTASQGVVVLVDKRSGPTPLGYTLFLANGQLGFQMANGVGSSACAATPTPGVACVNYVAPASSPNVADGQWHHVAAVVDRADATNGVRLYVDGVQVFAGAPLGAAPPSGSPPANLDNTSDLYLGVRTPAMAMVPGGDAFLRGDLDEVELIKRALTPQEIQTIYNAGPAGKCKAQPQPSPTADLGDAPDSKNHPNKGMTTYSTSVTANFPTVFATHSGPKHLQPKGLAWLGKDVSFEDEADLLPDGDSITNIDPPTNAANQDGKDDGVALPIAIPLVCGQTQFNYTVTSTAAAKLYVNVWFDFNRDGDWDDPIQKCPLGPASTGSFTEWAVQNQPITVSGPGTFTFTTPPFGAANPTKGSEMWMRITLTDQPIAPANGADGSGPATGYKFGETEDYLLRLSYTELCGIKFNDLNGNGKQDTNEPGLANWVIEVKDANGNFMGYAVTDADGKYCIVVPVPGTYTVSEQQQPGWTQTAPSAPGTYTVTVPPAHTDLNFGNQEKKSKAEICIFKFNDLNGNGKQDANEPPLPGWQFAVSPAPLPPTTSPVTTGPQGGICFGVSAPGTYTITEVVQSGWTPTTPNPQTVTVAPGQLVNVFFGNQKKEEGVCDREIKKTVTPNPVQSGGTVTITLTVTNVGTAPCPVVPGINVADPQPPGMTFQPPVSVNKPGWSCGFTPPGVIAFCTSTSPLLPGPANAVMITFTAKVTAPPGSQIQNCAEVTNVGDANQNNNKSCVTINVTGIKLPPLDLTLAKLLDGVLRPESEVTYALRVTNVGGSPTTGPIRVVDPLPPTLRFVAAAGLGWSCSAQGQNVICASAGPIAPNQSSTILLRVRVAAQPGQQITNCAIVETEGDANPANNRGCHTGTVQR